VEEKTPATSADAAIVSSSQAYLEGHGIMPIVQSLLADLLTTQPPPEVRTRIT
jgi:hypothetical protein